VISDPSIRESVTYDNGSHAEFSVEGSPMIDQYAVEYYSPDGYDFRIDSLYAVYAGQAVLAAFNMNLYTDADAGGWLP
jgi:hypothetical protein